MARDVSEDEIKRAMFNIGAWKAPRGDGFSAIFFHKNWSTVGSSVIQYIKEMWSNPAAVNKVNQTVVTLIPKVELPERVSQFRPISLCNVIYKCFSKILVARLKHCMPNIISPH